MYQSLQEAWPRGYIAAYRILGNADESEEACQEAAARAWASRDRYEPSRPFYPWFYRILKNYCLDRLRQRQRLISEDTTESTEQVSAFAESPPSAEANWIEQEQNRALNQAIAQLPEEYREMIELRHFQDLSYEDMADILHCPVGTVMSRLYRARQALRNLLQHNPNFSFPSSNREELS